MSGRISSAAKPHPGALHVPPVIPEVAIVQRDLDNWLDGLYKASERKKFLFKPTFSITGHAENDKTHNARRYAIDMQVKLMCHDGQLIRVDDEFRIMHLVELGDPFPYGNTLAAFQREIISKMPDWRELYLSRHEPSKDENVLFSPSLLTGLKKPPPMPPMIKPSPMPGSLSAAAAAYGKAGLSAAGMTGYQKEYMKMMEAKYKAEAEAGAMKIKTDHLYGYAVPRPYDTSSTPTRRKK